MKPLKIALAALALVVLNQFVVLLAALPFGMVPESDAAGVSRLLFLSFLVAALPMAGLSYLAARVVRPVGMAQTCISGGVWALTLALAYLLIGLGNGNLAQIFACPSLYLMFAGTFAGPLLLALGKKKTRNTLGAA